MYSFEHIPGFVSEPCYKAAHTFELPFIYTGLLCMTEQRAIADQLQSHLSALEPLFAFSFGGSLFSKSEVMLSTFMRTAWTTMAATRTPNVGSDSSWTTYDAERASYLVLDIPRHNGHGFLR